jgi:hypothetical protein
MALRTKGTWFLPGLAAIVAFFVAGQTAQAGGIKVVSGTTMQTGDPTYEYLFDVDLLAGSTLVNGGLFTVYDLPGLTGGALTSQPSIFWGSSVQLLGITPSGAVITDDPTIYNVTWQWNGAPVVAPDNSDLFLGTFIVGSTTELPSPPVATVLYLGTLDGGPPFTFGSVSINSVPEPSSVILLLMGAWALPAVVLHERRRRRQQIAA